MDTKPTMRMMMTDGGTDGQTDTARRHRPRLCVASHGNKFESQNLCCDFVLRLIMKVVRSSFNSDKMHGGLFLFYKH